MKARSLLLNIVIILFGCLLIGCATSQTSTPILARRYYGTWHNVNAAFFNWWVINAAGAVNYGIALDSVKCGARSATILASNKIDVPFGNKATVTLHLVEGTNCCFNKRTCMLPF
jgi:hypothetical protein